MGDNMVRINTDEIIELFLGTTIYQIKSEREVPNISFKFNSADSDTDFIYRAFKNNIKYLMEHLTDDCICVEVHDNDLFFRCLSDIISETIKLSNEYEGRVLEIPTALYILRRIWLRMGITDIENVEQFLNRQLQFVTDRTLDTYKKQKVDVFEGYDIFMKTIKNDSWDETTRSMIFTIERDNECYELPRVLYDIDNNKTCYIYGVQSAIGDHSKHIERKLYKLNKGIENPNVHPSKVLSLLLFIKELKEKGITKIVVPSMQVLSYRYHELLSNQSKIDYEDAKSDYEKQPGSVVKQIDYKYAKDWYNRVYEKQDKISYLKTEELISLIYRLTEHEPNIDITNDVTIQGDSMVLKLGK